MAEGEKLTINLLLGTRLGALGRQRNRLRTLSAWANLGKVI
jgi:hypothetical protein